MLKHIIVLVLCFMPYIIGNLGDKTPLDYLGEVQRFVECYGNKNEIRCSTIKNKTGISIENSGLCPDATKTNALKNKFTQEFDQVMDSTQFISLINKCKSNTSDQSNPLNTFVHNYDWLKNDKVSTCCIQYSQRTPKSLGI
eukprot:XP_008181306.1 PREDICTED: uncharacterized protein LOC100571631 isoform X2 [Acyrthosiphon pisum]